MIIEEGVGMGINTGSKNPDVVDLHPFKNYKTGEVFERKFNAYFGGDFSALKKITQVWAFVLNKEHTKVLLARSQWKTWQLPGGGIEDGETPHQTLVREVMEETNRTVDLETITPFYYQETYLKENEEWAFNGEQVRYVVTVDDDRDFVADTGDGKIVETKWVDVDKIDEYLEWGETIARIKQELPKFL